jgi:hypothetical protein
MLRDARLDSTIFFGPPGSLFALSLPAQFCQCEYALHSPTQSKWFSNVIVLIQSSTSATLEIDVREIPLQNGRPRRRI